MGSAAKALAAKTRAEILQIVPGVHSQFSIAAIDTAYNQLEADVRAIPDWKDRVHFVATKGAPLIIGAATALGGPQGGIIATALLAGVAQATSKDGAAEEGLSDDAILDLLQKVSDIVLTPGKVDTGETTHEDGAMVEKATALLSGLAAGHHDTTSTHKPKPHHDTSHTPTHPHS